MYLLLGGGGAKKKSTNLLLPFRLKLFESSIFVGLPFNFVLRFRLFDGRGSFAMEPFDFRMLDNGFCLYFGVGVSIVLFVLCVLFE